VKCKLAVGAATLHSVSAQIVWYLSLFSISFFIYGGNGISHSFSIVSKKSIFDLLNLIILHVKVSFITSAFNQKSNFIFFQTFKFFPG
jgi:hypothetical protein